MDLVSRLKDKEEEALTILMEHYGQYLLHTAYLLVKDKHLAEEMVQDTFVTAYEKIDQLDNPHKLRNWLTVITINHCRAKMRKWSWKNIFLRYSPEDEELEEGGESTEEIVLVHDRNQHVVQAIQELDYKYREVIILYYFNEWSIAEISAYIGENVNTIKSRLARGRKHLKFILEREGVEYDG